MSDPIVPGALWIVSAPSGGGKTSLTRALVRSLAEKGVAAEISVSYTTRQPRPGEQDGVHYHFVDEPTFVDMVGRGDFLEHAQVFGRRYGTASSRTGRLLAAGVDVMLDIDWQGAQQVRAQRPDARSIFILPPSAMELERRLRARGQDSGEVIVSRMQAARAEMEHHGEYDYLIVNRDFDTALGELEAIFISRTLLSPQQQLRHAALIAALLADGS